MPDFPARGVQIAQALYAANPGLTTGTAEQQQLFVQLVAEQMAFELSTDYGLKRAAFNRPQGPSQIAYDSSGPFGGWRIIDNDGSVTGVKGGILPSPVWQDFSGQVFMPVKPTDHLKVSEPTPPIPPTPTPAPVDLAPLLDRLATLEQTVTALAAQMPVVAAEAHAGAHRPLPRYVAKLWGFTIVSVPEGA